MFLCLESIQALASIIETQNINLDLPAKVIVGQDTRASSPALTTLFISGAKALGATVVDLGIVTTPQLHYVVRSTWQNKPESASVEGYYTDLTKAFLQLIRSARPALTLVDCANGVGKLAAAEFGKRLEPLLQLSTINTGAVHIYPLNFPSQKAP